MTQDRGITLVVDDEESVRTVLRRALELAGYDVVTAASGQEALDALALHKTEVMLLDLGMPGLSGQEVLQRVKAEHPDVAVIVVTAMADVQVAVDAMKAGACDYATKPVNLDDLTRRVRKALERRWLVLREKEYQRELDRKLQEQEERLRIQFAQLIESLAREHTMALELEVLCLAKKQKGLFSKLPSELQQPKASVQEFAQALLNVLHDGTFKVN